MRPAPLISIVIPCYNHAQFLREALGSVVCNSRPCEIVVIDDGSTDDSAAVVDHFESAHSLRLVRQENAGVAAARNRGLHEAVGRYVVFLDADDRLATRALDIGAAALNDHPTAAFVFGRCVMMSKSGELLPTPTQPLIARDHYRELLRRNFLGMPAMVMFRRDAVERAGGFRPNIDASADYDLYLHIARHHPVHDHGQVVAHYRRHDTNMRGDASRMLRETLAVLRSQRPFLEGDAASVGAYREGWRMWQDFYGAQLVNEIRAHLSAGRWVLAMRKALTLGRYHPRGLAHHLKQKSRVAFRNRRRQSSLAAGP